jgi:hypothetical protein
MIAAVHSISTGFSTSLDFSQGLDRIVVDGSSASHEHQEPLLKSIPCPRDSRPFGEDRDEVLGNWFLGVGAAEGGDELLKRGF